MIDAVATAAYRDAMSTAQAGMLNASDRANAAASGIAAEGTTSKPAASPASARPNLSPLRVAYLPMPGETDESVSNVAELTEAEMSFKLNAAVMRTTMQMVQSLYHAVD